MHTTSGLQGTITGLTDDTVDLEIAPGVVTRWIKLAVRDRIESEALVLRRCRIDRSDADRLSKD